MRILQAIPIISMLFLLSACGKDDDDPVIPEPGPTTPATYEPTLYGDQGVQMTVDGQLFTAVEGGSIIPFYMADGVKNTPPQQSYRFYAAGMYSGQVNVFQLHLGTLTYTSTFLDPVLFQEFFATGPREYGITSAPGMSHVKIEFIDGDGVLWSTEQGSGEQENSTFTIADVLTGYDEQSVYARIISNFNCTLYDPGGDPKTVTEGILMLEFREY